MLLIPLLNILFRHRHQVDHHCEKYEAPQPKMTQTAQHVQDILGIVFIIVVTSYCGFIDNKTCIRQFW